MTKEQFLIKLAQLLKSLSNTEIEEAIEYYSEIIQDRMDDGICEKDAINELGDIEEIANSILNNSLKETKKPSEAQLIIEKSNMEEKKHKVSGTKVLLLVLLFPFWFSLLMIGGSLLLSVFMTIVGLTIAYYSSLIYLPIAVVLNIIALIKLLTIGEPLIALSYLGMILLYVGLFLILLAGAKHAYKFAIKVSKSLFNEIKKIIKKGVNIYE